jgi:hypothetical protein
MTKFEKMLNDAMDTIRLFRNPHTRLGVKELIKLVDQNQYDGRYYTTHPEDAIGYYTTGQMIEVELPVRDIAPEQQRLASNLVIDDPKPTQLEIQKGAEEAKKLGVPERLVNQIVDFTMNKDNLITRSKPSDIICTVDGCLTKDMARKLQETFRYLRHQAGQVQLLTRNIGQGELVAIYEYKPRAKSKRYQIINVRKISGMPTLTKGQIIDRG